VAEQVDKVWEAPVAPPPRQITRKARRRSWAERQVRVWWLAAVALGVVGAYVTGRQVIQSARDRWLIREGMEVQAEVIGIEGIGIGKLVGPEENRVFTLRFMQRVGESGEVSESVSERNVVRTKPIAGKPDHVYNDEEKYLVFTTGRLAGIARPIEKYANGTFTLKGSLPEPAKKGAQFRIDCEAYQFSSRLKDQRKQLAFFGELPASTDLKPEASVITLHVDPEDFSRWTDRQQTTMLQDVFMSLWLLPGAAILLVVAMAMRQRVLRTWRNGQLVAGIVVDSRQSALAPLSRLVRFSPRDSRDQRVFYLLIPSAMGVLQRGSVLWVVAPQGRLDLSIPAALYQ